MTSIRHAFQDGQHRGDIGAQQHAPGGIQGDLGLDGQYCPVSLKACWMPVMAALTSRISCEVSITSRSTPPSIKPAGLLAEDSTSSSKVMLDSSGSFIEGSLPDGPIEPATKRGWPSLAVFIGQAARQAGCPRG